jgi:hypothetical protein
MALFAPFPHKMLDLAIFCRETMALQILASGSFEEDSWGWQWHKLSQRIGEWLQFQPSKEQTNPPDSLESLDWSRIGEFIGWVAIALLAIFLLWQLLKRLPGGRFPFRKPSKESSASTANHPELSLSLNQWRSQSRQFQQQGNYRQACRCLYMAMLRKLHESGIVADNLAITDGEYRVAISHLSNPQPYIVLLQIHEQHHFANRDATLEDWQACQQAYRQIQQQFAK